ncbi:unnamed protein product [Agarophyton chilense]
MVELNTNNLFTLLYSFVSLFTVSAFGYGAERCDIVQCSDRFKVFLAFSFFVFFISFVMLVFQIIRLPVADVLHKFVTPFLFALNTVSCALVISPRSGINASTVEQIVWWAQIACVLLVFLSFSDMSGPAPEKPGLEMQGPSSMDQSEMSAPREAPADTPLPNV